MLLSLLIMLLLMLVLMALLVGKIDCPSIGLLLALVLSSTTADTDDTDGSTSFHNSRH